MDNAFVDTTILVDAVLKSGAPRSSAVSALGRYRRTDLPMYALKELKIGALSNYVWIHNKFASLRSQAKVTAALQAEARTPRHYKLATALQAMHDAQENLRRMPPEERRRRFGDGNPDAVLADIYRLSIKLAIFKGWKKAYSACSAVVNTVACFDQNGPREENGLVVLDTPVCRPIDECSLAAALKAKPELLRKMRDAIVGSEKREDQRRSKALKTLIKRPRDPLSPTDCRRLGDAIFAFFCPLDAAILTTNVVDHKRLATPLGKTVEAP